MGQAFALPVLTPGGSVTVTGTTVGFAHDYDEACPYGGSLAPDVVYAYVATDPLIASINADFCYSTYDTKVIVYDNAWTPGAPLVCNDDDNFAAPCCTYYSFVGPVPVVVGHTYYIVVDGWGSQSGTYTLVVSDGGIVPPSGACCAPSGACTIKAEVVCVAPSILAG